MTEEWLQRHQQQQQQQQNDLLGSNEEEKIAQIKDEANVTASRQVDSDDEDEGGNEDTKGKSPKDAKPLITLNDEQVQRIKKALHEAMTYIDPVLFSSSYLFFKQV